MLLELPDIISRLKDRNLSEVARQIKCTPSYLSLLVRTHGTEKQQNPKYDTLKKLSDYLEKNP